MRRDVETLVTITSSTNDFGTVSVGVGPEHRADLDRVGLCGPYVATLQVNATGVTPKGVFSECTTVVHFSSGRARALSAALLVAAEIIDRESQP